MSMCVCFPLVTYIQSGPIFGFGRLFLLHAPSLRYRGYTGSVSSRPCASASCVGFFLFGSGGKCRLFQGRDHGRPYAWGNGGYKRCPLCEKVRDFSPEKKLRSVDGGCARALEDALVWQEFDDSADRPNDRRYTFPVASRRFRRETSFPRRSKEGREGRTERSNPSDEGGSVYLRLSRDMPNGR